VGGEEGEEAVKSGCVHLGKEIHEILRGRSIHAVYLPRERLWTLFEPHRDGKKANRYRILSFAPLPSPHSVTVGQEWREMAVDEGLDLASCRMQWYFLMESGGVSHDYTQFMYFAEASL